MPYDDDQYRLEAAALAGWLFAACLTIVGAGVAYLGIWVVRAILGK